MPRIFGLLPTDGGPLWRFPHSQIAAAATWSSRCRQGQHVLEATTGTIQTPKQVISLPAGPPPSPLQDLTSAVWTHLLWAPPTPPPSPQPASNPAATASRWSTQSSVHNPQSTAECAHCYSKAHAFNERELMKSQTHTYITDYIVKELGQCRLVLPDSHFTFSFPPYRLCGSCTIPTLKHCVQPQSVPSDGAVYSRIKRLSDGRCLCLV